MIFLYVVLQLILIFYQNVQAKNICRENSLRLKNGAYGTLECCINNDWFGVSSDSVSTATDVTLICEELQFSSDNAQILEGSNTTISTSILWYDADAKEIKCAFSNLTDQETANIRCQLFHLSHFKPIDVVIIILVPTLVCIIIAGIIALIRFLVMHERSCITQQQKLELYCDTNENNPEHKKKIEQCGKNDHTESLDNTEIKCMAYERVIPFKIKKNRGINRFEMKHVFHSADNINVIGSTSSYPINFGLESEIETRSLGSYSVKSNRDLTYKSMSQKEFQLETTPLTCVGSFTDIKTPRRKLSALNDPESDAIGAVVTIDNSDYIDSSSVRIAHNKVNYYNETP